MAKGHYFRLYTVIVDNHGSVWEIGLNPLKRTAPDAIPRQLFQQDTMFKRVKRLTKVDKGSQQEFIVQHGIDYIQV